MLEFLALGMVQHLCSMNTKVNGESKKMRMSSVLNILLATLLMALPSLAYGAKSSNAVLPGKSGPGIAKAPSLEDAFAKLPVIDGHKAMASVEGDPVTVGEFARVMAQIHGNLGDSKAGDASSAKRIDYSGVLGRLINITLAEHEAIRIGLDQIPAVKKQIHIYSDKVLAGMVLPSHFKGAKPDPIVERNLYRAMVKEYKMKSAVFAVKSAAQNTQKDILAKEEQARQKKAIDLLNTWANHESPGEDFDKVVKEAANKGIIAANLKGYYVSARALPENVARLVGQMKVGQTTPLIQGGVNTYVLLKLEGVRYPAGNKKALEQARQTALQIAEKSKRALFEDKLERKYIILHKDILRWLDKLDYTAKGFDIHKLEKDKRVLADVRGGEPVTVADVAAAIDNHFYHGLNTAKPQEVHTAKNIILSEMFAQKALIRQAEEDGLNKNKEYKAVVGDYRRTLLFALFMQTIVAPKVQVKPQDLTAYYKKHIEDYSSDERMRVRAIVFKKSQDAQAAVSKIKKGDEFDWVKTNAQGQAPKDEKGHVDFGDGTVYVNSFPADVQKTLSGAKTGDVRLYAGRGAKKRFYALYVVKEEPAVHKPFSEVKDEIQNKVVGEKTKELADEWFSKLKKASDVQVYYKPRDAKVPDGVKK